MPNASTCKHINKDMYNVNTCENAEHTETMSLCVNTLTEIHMKRSAKIHVHCMQWMVNTLTEIHMKPSAEIHVH